MESCKRLVLLLLVVAVSPDDREMSGLVVVVGFAASVQTAGHAVAHVPVCNADARSQPHL